MYRPVAYGVKEDTGIIDYDMMEEVALKEKPKMIIGALLHIRENGIMKG